jgi:uncharacterized protein (TIGR01777 family)
VWVWVLVSLILVEVGLTLWDFVVEDSSRLLPNSERITHTLLAINGGAAFVLLALELPHWYSQTSALQAVDYGWQSWFLTAAAVGVAVSGVRDGLAAWQLQRMNLQLQLDLGGHKRVLISGGSGFIGSALCRELLAGGHQLTVISRRPTAVALQFGGRVRAVADAAALSSDEVFDVIVNLAGAPIVGLPWSARRKRVLLHSRLHTTQQLLDFVARAHTHPTVWVQASAVGYYGAHSPIPLDENAAPGQGFAAELCEQWEALTAVLQTQNVRCITLRCGLVFGRSGGALPPLLLPFRFGLGAVVGDGQQYLSWIHIEDLLRLIAHSIADESVQGTVNAVAPDSPNYQAFTQLTGELLQRPVVLRIPAKVLRSLLGEMATLLVDGPHIQPQRLQQMAFEYRFPSLRSALMDLA